MEIHEIQHFYDKATNTLTYVVWDKNSKDAVVIDPVWDYDPASSKLSDTSAKNVIDFLNDHQLQLHYILETHAHADHISGAQLIKRRFPTAKIGIGKAITQVQETFKKVYHLSKDFPTDGRQFDQLFSDQEIFKAGSLSFKVISSPGHTPACSCYLLQDALFTGDTLFMPDSGVARCDFPNGSAKTLYASVQKLYRLPDQTRIFTAHDYQPNNRELQYQSTIGESKKNNIHLKASTTEADFVEFREKRDRGLSAPRLLLPSLQINIDAGKIPPAESNGSSYLKIPLSGA